MQERTTIQISGDLRRKLKVLASKRDVSYQKLLNDMISVFSELDKDKVVISVPKKLAEKIQSLIKGTDIKSVSEYVTFVLRMILSEKSEKITKFDEKKIKARLKALGYL